MKEIGRGSACGHLPSGTAEDESGRKAKGDSFMKPGKSFVKSASGILLSFALALGMLPFAADAQAAGTSKNPTAGQDHQFVVNDDECDHDWSDWVLVKPATGTEDGERMRYCRIDASHTQREAIPATGEVSPFLALLTSPTSTSVQLTWMKNNDAYGYEIYFNACGNGDKNNFILVKTLERNDILSYGRVGLKANTPYKAYVKAYAYRSGKKTYIGQTNTVHVYTGNCTKNYTIPQKVAVKKSKITLKKGKTYQIVSTITLLDPSKKQMPDSHGNVLRYVSCNTKVATVSKSGKITAKGAGTAKIYVIAHNGVRKAMQVTVK